MPAAPNVASQRLFAPQLTSTVIALIAFFTLVDLFASQAILPLLAKTYGARPSQIGVAVNASTAGMALGALITALIGARWDRRRGVALSLLVLTVPSALLAIAPNLGVFAALRVAQGLCMSCAFTLTLAHLGEACTPQRQAGAFAAYITGNVASNLVGRTIAAVAAGLYGSGTAFLIFAGLNLVGAALAFVSLRSDARPEGPVGAGNIKSALSPRLIQLYAIGFLILFAFIGVFSYVNFVLMHPPLGLGMMSLGAVYLVFAPSILATPWAGPVAGRYGALTAMGIGLAVALAGLALLSSPVLPLVICGMVLVGLGTFFAQATATGQVSQVAGVARSQASGLYLTAYFAGGLAGAAVVGQVYERLGWTACLWLIGLALAGCAGLGLSVARAERPPGDAARDGRTGDGDAAARATPEANSRLRAVLGETLAELRTLDAPLNIRLNMLARAVERASPEFAHAVEGLIERLTAGGLGAGAPKVGDAMPPFLLPDQSGRLIHLGDVLASGPAVVVFYRGHWCSYCRMTAEAYARVQDEIGPDHMVAITPESAAFNSRLADATGIDCRVLTDPDSGYALSLNLSFWVDDRFAEAMRSVGQDLGAYRGRSAWILPVPATFVVDRQGVIVARHVDPDYRRRMDVDELVSAFRGAV